MLKPRCNADSKVAREFFTDDEEFDRFLNLVHKYASDNLAMIKVLIVFYYFVFYHSFRSFLKSLITPKYYEIEL